METGRKDNLQTRGDISSISLLRGLGCGLAGGLAGTMVMDIALMAALPAAGYPALTCFTIVGDTVAKFFSMRGIEMAGGVPLGVISHYLIGPAAGAGFGTLVMKFDMLKLDTLRKSIILAILYVQILSQPILATTPILLKMTVTGTLKWYGGSFVMHSVLGAVLGIFMSYAMRPKDRLNRGWVRAQLAGENN